MGSFGAGHVAHAPLQAMALAVDASIGVDSSRFRCRPITSDVDGISTSVIAAIAIPSGSAPAASALSALPSPLRVAELLSTLKPPERSVTLERTQFCNCISMV